MRSLLNCWAGMGLWLWGAYGLISLGLVEVDSLWYLLLNLTGAIGIMIDAYHDGNTQPVVLNLIWAGIALFGLWQVIF